MNWLTYASSLLSFLIFATVVGSARSASVHGCSSSCGLQSIRHPFRLKGDPAVCGVSEYELTCTGNRTILELSFGRYFVTSISYETATLTVVDANLESSNCSLPFIFPSPQWVYNEDRSFYAVSSRQNFQLPAMAAWATFVNCSAKSQYGDDSYIPCLSGKNVFVHALYGTSNSYISELRPNCSFLSRVPTDANVSKIDGFPNDAVHVNDIFQLLQKGFTIEWGDKKFTRSQVIQYCLRSSSREVDLGRKVLIRLLCPLPFVRHVLGCLHGSIASQIPYVISFAVVISLYATIQLIVIAMLIRCLVAPHTIYVFLANEYWKMVVRVDSVEKFLRNLQTLAPSRYAYSDIVALTRNFKEKLGQGGFGSVYKGELPGGHFVAIKVLADSKSNGEDFINEVSTIGRIHHLNIVRLIGFCSEGSKRALLYEFMPNGSLDKYIFSSKGNRRCFTKEKLNEIALGVARGIDYLHRGCDMRILHFDIKPHNILLDQNFNPKVSDFGLAKLYRKDYSLVSVCAARGTIGYIAPELVSRSFGVVSYKSDVYSFGMLLLEMAGGRRNVDHGADNSSEVYYPSWIYDQLVKSEEPGICNYVDIDCAEKKLCKIGLWCIQMRPPDRPSMSKVIEMLQAEADAIQMPPKPFFSPASGPLSSRQSCTDYSPLELSITSEDS